MKRITIEHVFAALAILALLAACAPQTAPQTGVPSVPQATPVLVAPTPTVAPQTEPKFDFNVSSDCKMETQLIDGLANARSSCGGGTYVVVSQTTFKGDEGDPGVQQNVVAAVHASGSWTNVSGSGALYFFASQEDARNAVCTYIKQGYMLMLESGWVLGGVKCK